MVKKKEFSLSYNWFTLNFSTMFMMTIRRIYMCECVIDSCCKLSKCLCLCWKYTHLNTCLLAVKRFSTEFPVKLKKICKIFWLIVISIVLQFALHRKYVCWSNSILGKILWLPVWVQVCGHNDVKTITNPLIECFVHNSFWI